MKEDLRRTCLEHRARIEAPETKSTQISRALLGALGEHHKVIAAYAPFRSEASPLGAVEELIRRGLTVLFPLISGRGLEFRQSEPSGLAAGRFGIKEPAKTDLLFEAQQIDVVLAPGVGFTREGDRLGYGGGYYDRFLATYRQERPDGLVIGFCFESQVIGSIPRETQDQPVDAIVSEMGLHYV